MNERNQREEKAVALWRQLRAQSRVEAVSGQAEAVPDSMTLAAYLDGTLDETARQRVEAWLAAAPEGLELVLAARAALAEPTAPAPESLIRRASALVPAARPPGLGLAGWLGDLFAPIGDLGWTLGWSGTAAALLLACFLGFELGQAGYASAVAVEPQLALESGFDFDPVDEEIL